MEKPGLSALQPLLVSPATPMGKAIGKPGFPRLSILTLLIVVYINDGLNLLSGCASGYSVSVLGLMGRIQPIV